MFTIPDLFVKISYQFRSMILSDAGFIRDVVADVSVLKVI